jgi:phage major head subunit gpT-like protein
MQVNGTTLRNLYVAFVALYAQAFASATTQWQKIATLVPSSTKENEYGWLGKFPKMRKWIGERHIKKMETHGYSIKNEPFESTVAVDKNDIEDDQVGIYNPLMQEMGDSSAHHPDELVFGLLADGFSKTCYDGQFFFDTDHPVKNPETGAITSVSNMQAGAGAPWFLLDASRPLKPLIFQKRKEYKFVSLTDDKDDNVFMRNEYIYGVDARVNVGFGFWQMAFGSKAALNADNIADARKSMMSLKSDEGHPLAIKPTILVVGPSNMAAAELLNDTPTLANGAANPNYKRFELIVSPYLT